MARGGVAATAGAAPAGARVAAVRRFFLAMALVTRCVAREHGPPLAAPPATARNASLLAGGSSRIRSGRALQESGDFSCVDIASTLSIDAKFHAAATAGNGRVVFAPYNADCVGVFDLGLGPPPSAPPPPLPPIIQGCGQGTTLDAASMQCQISCEGAGGRRLVEGGTPTMDEAAQEQCLEEAQQRCSGAAASAPDAHKELALLRAALAARRDALQAGAAASFTAKELEELLHFRQPAPA